MAMDTSGKIAECINGYGDWRTDLLKELRQLINDASPELNEDFKWGVPVWTSNGLVCAISGFKDHVKINFFKGVFLPDPKKIINSGLESKEHRSVNFNKVDKPDKAALTALVRAAAAYNKP